MTFPLATKRFASAIVLALLSMVSALAHGADRGADEQAIRAAGKTLLEALARADVAAIAQVWTEDGEYIDPQGNAIPAADMLKSITVVEGELRPVAAPTEQRFRFVADDVAIEDGAAEMPAEAGNPPALGRYTAVWVRRNGKWRLSSLRDVVREEFPGLYQLAWLLGDWQAESDGKIYELRAEWTPGEKFILRRFSLSEGPTQLINGVQVIGWDPLVGQIRSWVFDSGGGFGEGTWTWSEGKWWIDSQGIDGEGNPLRATNCYEPIDGNHFEWRSKPSGDGELLSIRFVRKRAAR